VVTYDTIIEFDNPELKLFPGMTAYVSIPVATAAKVVKVPNAALRFKPDLPANELRALYQKFGLPEEGEGAKAADGSPAPTKPASGPKNEARIVWKFVSGKTLEPVRIRTGITDHTSTELLQTLNGSLKPGDALVTGVAQSRGSDKAAAPGGPRRP
jgi:HlyD family secretion protein